MRIAHIIMVHKEPKQIERLINKLSHDGNDFYIHVDKKSEYSQFYYLSDLDNTNLTNTRLSVIWGGYSLANAIIQCVKEIIATGIEYDFINLLSGQDYPIKSNEYIYNFLKGNIGKSFISYETYGSNWWSEAKHRVEKYHLTDFPFKGHYRIQQLINLVMPIRNFPIPYTLYGSNCATWWTISRECAEYIINFIEDSPRVRIFAQFSWAPDEYLIPTIILNSPLKDKIINNNLRYIDWSKGGPNPKILLDNDFEILNKSPMLFARKLDINQSLFLLNQLDKLTTNRS